VNHAYKASLIRGAIGGLFLALGTFFALAPNISDLMAFYAAGGIWSGYMATRFSEAVVTGDSKKPEL